MKKVSFWYCYRCNEEVCAENVTYQEHCYRCGNTVEWVTINVPETVEEDESEE